MSKKQELMDFLKKIGIKDEKINEVYAEKEAEVKNAGHTDPANIEILTLRKVSLYFRKVKTQKDATSIKIIPIGITPQTDYGAKRQYDMAKEMWEKDKQKAILEGYTNEQGTPLWRNTGIEAKKGKPIDWQKEITKNVYCLAKRDEDSIWKIGVLALKGDILKTTIEIGKLYETSVFVGNATKDMWQNSRIIMYSTNSTELKNPKNAPQPIIEMIETYAQDLIVPFKEIEVRAKQEKASSDYFIVKANVVKTGESQMGISNRIVFSDPEELIFDEEKNITGWIDEEIPLNIVDEAMDVYILMNSRAFMKKTDNGSEEEALQIQVFGFYASEEYMKTETNTPKVGNVGQNTLIQPEEKIEVEEINMNKTDEW